MVIFLRAIFIATSLKLTRCPQRLHANFFASPRYSTSFKPKTYLTNKEAAFPNQRFACNQRKQSIEIASCMSWQKVVTRKSLAHLSSTEGVQLQLVFQKLMALDFCRYLKTIARSFKWQDITASTRPSVRTRRPPAFRKAFSRGIVSTV